MKIAENTVSAYTSHTTTLNVKKGQVVVGTITKRLTDTTAMVRVGGQLFETRFAKGLPQANHILLKFDSMAGSRFIFTLVEPKATLKNDILLASPSHYPSFLHALRTLDSLTVFTVHKALLENMSHSSLRFTVIAPLLQRLLDRGVAKDIVQKFCYTLSRENGISVIMCMLQNIGDSSLELAELTEEEIHSVLTMMTKEDIETLTTYITDNSKNGYILPFYDGQTFNDAYILSDDNYICIDVTFSYLGKLNIVIQQKDILTVTMYCFNDQTHIILNPRCNELSQLLQEHTGKKALCTCMKRNEWEEKIIAFINNMYIQYSIDFSV